MVFYVECDNQRRMVNILWGIDKPNHPRLGGRGGCLSQIRKEKENYVALLDEDPQAERPTEKLLLKEGFELVKKEGDMKLFKDKNNNLIITLSPDLEGWIYRVAKKEEVKLG